MKKLHLIALAMVIFSACKKDHTPSVILSNGKWVLITATAAPAKTIGGKTSTDLITLDNSTCLANSYTMKFNENGTYHVSSSGPLCDMFSDSQQWSLVNETLDLQAYEATIKTLDKDHLNYTFTIDEGGTSYTYTYGFLNK